MNFKSLVLMSPFVAGCTSITVRPVDPAAELQRVCIIDNPRVMVSDFVSVLRDGFDRHHIATSVVPEAAAESCDVAVTYTALRSWDLAPYLSHAELRLWRGGRQIGAADYHLTAKGGFSFMKWNSTRSKLDPVIDQLLSSR